MTAGNWQLLSMQIRDLGVIAYMPAWEVQRQCHAQAQAGGEESLLLLEHSPVITFGRRAADSARNLLASTEQLAEMGVEVVESDRGGDITFHGPGQLVAYPILRVQQRGLLAGGYVHRLEEVVIKTLAEFGVTGTTDRAAPGVWVERSGGEGAATGSNMMSATSGNNGLLAQLLEQDRAARGNSTAAAAGTTIAKICALGVRIREGISMHGIALNLSTDMRYFELINPCGLSRPVTSLRQVLGETTPTMQQLKDAFARHLVGAFPDPPDPEF